MSSLRRRDGYVPIADYAVLGDGRTVALVAADGRLDWWPMPTLDAAPVVAAILDPRDGGHFALAPTAAFAVQRRYVPETNVLETTYTTSTGTARVTTSLNVGGAGRLPWTELAWRLEGLEGSVDMAWEFVPGDRFGQARPSVTLQDKVPVVEAGDQTLALITDNASGTEVSPHLVSGAVALRPGSRRVLAVIGTTCEPLPLPEPRHIDARIDATVESWQRWSTHVDYEGRWPGAVRRSALALKTLLFEPGGAIAAAASTSLPEVLGSSKNWDYRFAWVRDSSFTLDAFIELGLHEEVHAAVSWLLAAVRRSAPDLHVFYTLEGGLPGDEQLLDVPGYRHSRPARAGNGAARQSQLGTYGDLLDTVWRYVNAGHLLDHHTGQLLAELTNHCCATWMDKDSGLWELAQREHYTISKIGCWAALDRATRLAAAGHLPDESAARWGAEAAAVRSWIDANCWSESKQAYVFFAGTHELDAAVLLAGRTGFDRGPRLRSTIDAIVTELGRGPYLYRYSGMQDEEGAFVACTFWLVEALLWTGQFDRAMALMDRAVGFGNDLGVLSEQVDPATGEFLGNVPQGLSHLALINAANAFKHAMRPETTDRRPESVER